MILCSGCGHENEDVRLTCAGCGAGLVVSPIPPLVGPAELPPVLPKKRILSARSATLVLLAYLGGQIGAGIFVVGLGTIIAGIQGKDIQNPDFAAELTQKLTGPIAVTSVTGGGILALLISIGLFGRDLTDRAPLGAAWAIGSLSQFIKGLTLGASVAVAYVLSVTTFGAQPAGEMGPLAKMSMSPGLPQLLWTVTALLIAPPVEELLFRGILYSGFRRSFGPVRAAIGTTFIFVLLHITETIYFLPSIVGITALALIALWARLRAGAIGPAIAVHIGYNGVVVCGVLVYTLLAHRP